MLITIGLRVLSKIWFSAHCRSCLIPAFLVFVLVFPGIRVSAQTIQVGQRAPNLRGQNVINDSRISLYRLMTEIRLKKDAKGNLVKRKNGKFATTYIHNVTVLNFFAKTCVPCLREIPTFNRIADKFRGKPVKFLYINVDPFLPKPKARALIQRFNITIPMVLVNQNEADREYGPLTLPRLIIIDKQKKIRHIFTGFQDQLETVLTAEINNLL